MVVKNISTTIVHESRQEFTGNIKDAFSQRCWLCFCISCSLNSPNFNFVYCEEVFVLGGDTQSCLKTLTSSCIFPFRSQAKLFRSKFNCGLIWLFRAWKQQTRVVHNLIRYDDSPEFRISFSSRHVLFMTVALARLF